MLEEVAPKDVDADHVVLLNKELLPSMLEFLSGFDIDDLYFRKLEVIIVSPYFKGGVSALTEHLSLSVTRTPMVVFT